MNDPQARERLIKITAAFSGDRSDAEVIAGLPAPSAGPEMSG